MRSVTVLVLLITGCGKGDDDLQRRVEALEQRIEATETNADTPKHEGPWEPPTRLVGGVEVQVLGEQDGVLFIMGRDDEIEFINAVDGTPASGVWVEANSRTEFLDGRRHGTHTFWFPLTSAFEKTVTPMRHGQKHGVSIVYERDGNQEHTEFRDGEIIRSWCCAMAPFSSIRGPESLRSERPLL